MEASVQWMRTGAGLAAALVTGGLAACSSVSGLETQARILSQPACSDFFFPVYFRDRSSEVPAAARRVVGASSKRSQGCRIAEVKVVGLPAPGGAADPAMALARERAAAVAQMLKAAGFPEPVFELSPLGAAGAQLPDAQLPDARLARRRADVYVRFAR
jgi:outer membrane protein OmpA-like peptidoglycan-associated protein